MEVHLSSSSSGSPDRRISNESRSESIGISRSASKISEKTMIELKSRLNETEVVDSSSSNSNSSEDSNSLFTLKSQTSNFCSDTESALNARHIDNTA